jgi:hypothetical protein
MTDFYCQLLLSIIRLRPVAGLLVVVTDRFVLEFFVDHHIGIVDQEIVE